MRNIVNILMGFVIGVLFTGVLIWTLLPSFIIQEYQSPYDVKDTIKILEAGINNDYHWVIPFVKPEQDIVARQNEGGDVVGPVMLVNLCQTFYAHDILKQDSTKKVSVMMPCTFSVYEKSDGTTWVGKMNIGLLGQMFGGVVADIMGDKVCTEEEKMLAFLHAK